MNKRVIAVSGIHPAVTWILEYQDHTHTMYNAYHLQKCAADVMIMTTTE